MAEHIKINGQQQLHKILFFYVLFFFVSYAVKVSQKPDLDYITFHWNKMTAAEFEEHWRGNNMSKEVDFIHMIQVRVAMVMRLTHRTLL